MNKFAFITPLTQWRILPSEIRLKNTFLFTLFVLQSVGSFATDSLYSGQALLADIDTSGNTALVTGSAHGLQLVFNASNAPLSWELKLDRMPKDVNVLPGGRVLLQEKGDLLTEARENNRVVIYANKGIAWQAPGLAYHAVWSPKEARFLIKTLIGAQHLLQVYTQDGSLEHEVELLNDAGGDEREMTFSSDGTSVFLSPMELFGRGNMELHPLNGGAPFVVNLDLKMRVHRAFALSDSEIVFIASDGALRKLNKQGVVFEIHGENKPFSSLEISPDGAYVLAGRGYHGFDVYNTATGENLWHVDKRHNSQKLAGEMNLDALPGLKGQSLEERKSFLVGLSARIQDGGIMLENPTKADYQFWVGNPAHVAESLMLGSARGKSLCVKADSSWQVRFINGQTVREQLPPAASSH